MSDPRQHFRIPVNRRGFMRRNGATSLCTLVNLTSQGLQICAELPLLVGDRIDIECQLEAESLIHCTLMLTHAAGGQGGGRVVAITPQHHRHLMDFLDRQRAAPHNTP